MLCRSLWIENNASCTLGHIMLPPSWTDKDARKSNYILRDVSSRKSLFNLPHAISHLLLSLLLLTFNPQWKFNWTLDVIYIYIYLPHIVFPCFTALQYNISSCLSVKKIFARRYTVVVKKTISVKKWVYLLNGLPDCVFLAMTGPIRDHVWSLVLEKGISVISVW